jgi:GNAT superfamily N-acetyltransferase
VAEIEVRLDYASARDDHAVLVATADSGEIVGFVHAHERRLLVSEPYAELGGLVVAAEARRRGAGRRLVGEVERWARDRGLALVRVRSGVMRRDADAFYRAEGFGVEKEQTVFDKRLSR